MSDKNSNASVHNNNSHVDLEVAANEMVFSQSEHALGESTIAP